MPLFEYACRKCDHNFEALVFDGDKVECPECHGTRLEKLISVPAKPQNGLSSFPSACGDPSLPPCGATGCRRTGR